VISLERLRDLIQVDVGQRGLARDPVHNLFNALPDDFAAACHSLAAAHRVAILTGFYIADVVPPCGETDGPLGAVYLARGFAELGIEAELLTDEFCVRSLIAGLREANLPDVPVRCMPASTAAEVTHLIAIERVGRASDGRCYSMRGRDITDVMTPVHPLLEQCREAGITTIGIGDGGNEVGMGKLPIDLIANNIPDGAKIACRLATDHLIVAGISNWAAYAVIAGVASLMNKRLSESLLSIDEERRILETMIREGPLVDGKTVRFECSVDGLMFDDYAYPLKQIRDHHV